MQLHDRSLSLNCRVIIPPERYVNAKRERKFDALFDTIVQLKFITGRKKKKNCIQIARFRNNFREIAINSVGSRNAHPLLLHNITITERNKNNNRGEMLSRNFNISDRPRAQWRDFSDARFIPNAQREIFSRGARAEKGGLPREGLRARFVQRNRETLGSREARSRSIDPHYVVGAPLFTTASDRIWDGERERTARYRTIHIGEPYRSSSSSSSPGNCLAGSQHGVADTLALGIPERRG